ncbi:NADH-Ubiquinone/plastoquinone (complex I), various chains family protein [Neorickettsia helminthoeca str. Oregon]|uniref:NADH-Ubiquinone/plastoquinone (Complex I), various chains family protein n=1 Tax=Neorickettsia helminthoeca str. Oregon TaxID=1286528 RepID=X5H480_9RICK|nr:proton-conducting transporter membrane subunit [Neorickettsia helminthoeca]AHX11483.1 NADH-Ubiquinone/plastoquinone (complex I), various chains family protein [Neorickettsia helminthoeca str. Oregon]
MSILILIAIFGHLFPCIAYLIAGKRAPFFYYLISTTASIVSFLATLLIATRNHDFFPFKLFSITEQIGIAFHIDQAVIVFALLCSFLSIPASIYAISYMHLNEANKKASFFSKIHLSLAFTMMLAFSGNLITLFIFYELLTLATYALVKHEDTEKSNKCAKTYLSYLILPSVALFLPAILITYTLTGTFTFNETLHVVSSGTPRVMLLLMFIYGISKAAIFPMHGWLPKAMVAPTPVSALLHAVAVVKAGVFCITKVVIYVFTMSDQANTQLGSILSYICGFTIIFASIMALRKESLKEILAYSTISQLSYITITLGIFTANSVQHALSYMLMHAFAKITLFFTVGAIFSATGKMNKSQIDGIGRHMPITMISFTIGALAMIGLPPTATLLCKAHIFSEALSVKNYFIIFTLIVSTGLNCGYFLPIVFRAFFVDSGPIVRKRVLPYSLIFPYLLTTTVCIGLFVYQLYKNGILV